MLRRIRSLVSNCDRRLFDWLEGKDSRVKSSHSGRETPTVEGSLKSRSGVASPGYKVQVQIPDPWD